jgi:DNA-binding CsgD family transcriptional regulator
MEKETTEIINRYRAMLEFSASPFVATPERWRQCCDQAEKILSECADRVAGRIPQIPGALQQTAELGARHAAAQIPSTESARAALLLWQAAAPVFYEVLPNVPNDHTDSCPPLLTAFDALVQSLMTRLLHWSVGYGDVEMIRQVAYGSPRLLNPPDISVPNLHSASSSGLTAREQEVLTGVAKAMTNYEIGRELGIAETTVKRHLRNIFSKLDASSRMDAIHKAGLNVQPLQRLRRVNP